jgi:hypothetical protein
MPWAVMERSYRKEFGCGIKKAEQQLCRRSLQHFRSLSGMQQKRFIHPLTNHFTQIGSRALLPQKSNVTQQQPVNSTFLT